MCNKCNDTGYVFDEVEEIDGICTCAAGQALCGGTITDGRDEDDPSKSYYPAFKASLNGTDQGNDSLGLGMVKMTWREDGGEDGEGKPGAVQSHQIPSTQVTSFCAHLAGAGHCIDILVNGMHEKDYIDMVRGNTK